MKEYILIEYEFNGIKGNVILNSNITDENEIRDICIKDYLESNIKILKRDKKEGI